MAERHRCGGDGPDTLDGCCVAEPRQTASWDLHGGERVDERNQGWVDVSGTVVEEPVETNSQRAASAAEQSIEVVAGAAAHATEVFGDPSALRAQPGAAGTVGRQRHDPLAARALTTAAETIPGADMTQRPVRPRWPPGASPAPSGTQRACHVTVCR